MMDDINLFIVDNNISPSRKSNFIVIMALLVGLSLLLPQEKKNEITGKVF